MRGFERAVLRALLLGGGLLLSAVAHAQCTKDTDCKGDRVCDAGKCTYPGGLPPAPPPPPGSPQVIPPQGAPPPAMQQPPAGPPPVAQAPLAPPASAPAPMPMPVVTPAPAAATEPLPQADEPPTVRRSKPAMIAGIIMVSVGPIALLGALNAKNSQEKCDSALAHDYPNHVLPTSERYRADDCDAYATPYYVMLIGGSILTLGGIPLIIYGAKSLPAPPRAATVQVLPWATQTSGGLRLRVDL